jgi:Cu/Zn superoxide dismutase
MKKTKTFYQQEVLQLGDQSILIGNLSLAFTTEPLRLPCDPAKSSQPRFSVMTKLIILLCVAASCSAQAENDAPTAPPTFSMPDVGGSLGNVAPDEDGGDKVKNYAEMAFKNTYPGCGYAYNGGGAGTKMCSAQGTMYIEELESGTTRMYGLFYNLIDPSVNTSNWDTSKTTMHSAHIHMNAPTENLGCNAIGDIWDGQGVGGLDKASGFGHNHMGPHDQFRKLGDLGNVAITSSKQGGEAQFVLFDDVVTLEGDLSVVGRAMNIHYDPFGDDLGQYKPDLKDAADAQKVATEMGKMGVSMAAGERWAEMALRVFSCVIARRLQPSP